MIDRELIQQALFKITDMRREHTDDECFEIEETLRARLAQGEPEPVAWCIVENGRVHGLVKSKPAVMNAEKWQPLYTAPPQHEWQRLTDEEIDYIYLNTGDFSYDYERAIEAKLKKKNGG